MAKQFCSVAKCTEPAKSRGMCAVHHMRVRRTGSPHLSRRSSQKEPLVRTACDGICAQVLSFLAEGTTEIVTMSVAMRTPPELIVRHLLSHNARDVVTLLTDQGKRVPMRSPHEDIVCPDCGALVQSWPARSPTLVQDILSTHTCKGAA